MRVNLEHPTFRLELLNINMSHTFTPLMSIDLACGTPCTSKKMSWNSWNSIFNWKSSARSRHVAELKHKDTFGRQKHVLTEAVHGSAWQCEALAAQFSMAKKREEMAMWWDIYIIYSKIYYLYIYICMYTYIYIYIILYYKYIYIHLNKIDLHKVQFGDDDLPFTCQALACFFLTESPAWRSAGWIRWGWSYSTMVSQSYLKRGWYGSVSKPCTPGEHKNSW